MQQIESAVLYLNDIKPDKTFKGPFKVNGKLIETVEDLHKALNELHVLCFQQDDSTPAFMIPRSSITQIVVTAK